MKVCLHQITLLGILSAISFNLASAQSIDTLSLGVPVVEFVRAGHMGISPDGVIYVPDSDRNVVHAISSAGVLIRRMGGPGLSEGQFDGPSDVDPALGLVINIADKQNGRVQRFTKEFRFIESIPVPDGPGASLDENDPSFRSGQVQFQESADGRPGALTTSPVDDLYIIDEASNLVLRTDRERRNSWWIGEPGLGSGELRQPIDLVFKSQKLFVADRDCSCIQVYDQFGTYIRTISNGHLENIVAVTDSPIGVLAVLESKMVEYSTDGTLMSEIVVVHDSPLVDAVRTSQSWILLDQTGLFMIPIN